MKKFPLIFGLLFLTTGSIPIFAQTKSDPKAQEILKNVSAKYKGSKSISASFKINTLDQKSNTTDSQSGSILLKGDKYKLILKGQEIICDGKTVWTYIKETNEVQVNDVVLRSDGISPTTIFTIYEKGFSTKYLGEKKINNVTVQQIELVPDDNKKTYFKILIHVNKAEKVISSAKIFEKNGTHLFYSVDKLKMDTEVPDASFAFAKSNYPGVEVIDLR